MGFERKLRLFPALLLMLGATSVFAQPAPAPAPGSPPNIFYGATKPGAHNGPVIVFVHGLAGVASDWWVGNDMYALAHQSGFRTAFVSLSADNTRNHEAIGPNAAMLRALFPVIADHYDVPQFYVVTHSKGGVDTMAALMDPAVTHLAKAVLAIAPPFSGTELADWAFGPGRELAEKLDALLPGVLLSQGLFSLTTFNMANFRANADPFFENAGVPFYTIAGDSFLGNPLFAITGPILMKLSGGGPNDGLVPVERTLLPSAYANDLGTVSAHHFQSLQGGVSFWRLLGQIEALEDAHSFIRIATDGLGDEYNTWSWFAKWYKGKLYLGTGRAVNCVTFGNAMVQNGQPLYPPAIGDCPPDLRDLSLAAEIWRYTPESRVWERVFKSPENIPLGGVPMKFTAQDIGFRGAAVFKEPDGTEALYVSGVSASSLFEKMPQFANSPRGYPPPRILRTTDGVNWVPLPQAPGTFLGDIALNSSQNFKVRGFRTMAVLNNQLFVVATDYRGVGHVIGSVRPWEGNNSWRRVSPPPELLPVWTIRAFNNQLYAGTGDRRLNLGYGVYRTDATGQVPQWMPVVEGGGYQIIDQLRSPNVLNMLEFNGALYVGTDRPTELIRIHPDDRWDLIVGNPRLTPHGMKRPLSSVGQYFGNIFNGHFWNLGSYNGELYLGTWDWSVLLQTFGNIGEPFRHEFGFNLYKSPNGTDWSIVSRNGFADAWNYGVRSLETTPYGFFIGTAKPQDGLEVWLDNSILDFDGDGDVDQRDVDIAAAAVGSPAESVDDRRDIDRDGVISNADVVRLASQCTTAGCAIISAPPPGPPPPANLHAVSAVLAGERVLLKWQPSPGAVGYRVYKQPLRPILDFVPPDFVIKIPGTNIELTLEQIVNGALDWLCEGGGGSDLCALIDLLKAVDAFPGTGFPDMPRPIAFTTQPFYEEPNDQPVQAAADAVLPLQQSIYFVRAEGPDGRLSSPSNIVGAPSHDYPASDDSSPPQIEVAVSQPPNMHGWNNTDVTVSWTTNGTLTENCDPVTLTAETPQAGVTLRCTATSLLGARATRNVTIRIDKTPPSISGARAPGANAAGWNNTDVTVGFSCADALSGLASCDPGSQVVSSEGANQSRTGVAQDLAGNWAEAIVGSINIDKTAPAIAGSRFPAANAFGWNNTDVTVDFSCSDALSGLASCDPAQVLNSEGANQSRTGVALDRAGNWADATVGSISIDRTPPLVSAAPDTAPNENGWHNANVTVMFTAADALSGVRTVSPPVVIDTEGAAQSVAGFADDFAGNVAGRQLLVSLDKTPPEAFLNWDAATGDIAVFGRDALSGVPPGAVLPAVVEPARWAPIAFTWGDDRDDEEGEEGDDDDSPWNFGNRPTERRMYNVADLAGNTVSLSTILRRRASQLKARLTRFQVGDGAALEPTTRLQVNWSFDRKTDQLRELRQFMRIDRGREANELSGIYNSRKNVTVIEERPHRGKPKKVTLPGLVLIELTVARAGLGLSYPGAAPPGGIPPGPSGSQKK